MAYDFIVHNFQEQLDYSAELSGEEAWISFYRRLWPDAIMIVRIDKNSQCQKWGVDREILLPSGRRVSIDEKKRKKDYGDCLLEIWSVADVDRATNRILKTKKVGWTLDPEKRCDYIAYAIPTAGRCYLLPNELLRKTTQVNLEKWKESQYCEYPRFSENRGYTTVNIAVPWDLLFAGMKQQMFRKFGDELPLPSPKKEVGQMALNFDHAA